MYQYESKSGFLSKFIMFVLLPGIFIVAGIYLWRLVIEEHISAVDITVFDKTIEATAWTYGVDPLLVKAVVWQESRFNPLAKGSTNDYGLMQIVPTASVTDWAKSRRVPIPTTAALLDPQLNIEIGTWYLARQVYAFASKGLPLPVALAAYNAGPDRALEWFTKAEDYAPAKNPLPYIGISSTRAYVKSVLNKYTEYQQKAKRATIVTFNLGENE